MTDLGSDIAGISDLDAALSEVSGRTALAQACLRRLNTPTGTHPEDPSYGYSLVEVIGSGVTDLQIDQGVSAQMHAEEEIEQAFVEVLRIGDAIEITIEAVDSAGPFTLTVTANSLTTEMLLDGAQV